VKGRYIVRPRADRDIDRQAVYLAEHASSEIAYRFLIAVRETFALLASRPKNWMASSDQEKEGP
jgi:plasmid stabilization system protein ParE